MKTSILSPGWMPIREISFLLATVLMSLSFASVQGESAPKPAEQSASFASSISGMCKRC